MEAYQFTVDHEVCESVPLDELINLGTKHGVEVFICGDYGSDTCIGLFKRNKYLVDDLTDQLLDKLPENSTIHCMHRAFLDHVPVQMFMKRKDLHLVMYGPISPAGLEPALRHGPSREDPFLYTYIYSHCKYKEVSGDDSPVSTVVAAAMPQCAYLKMSTMDDVVEIVRGIVPYELHLQICEDGQVQPVLYRRVST